MKKRWLKNLLMFGVVICYLATNSGVCFASCTGHGYKEEELAQYYFRGWYNHVDQRARCLLQYIKTGDDYYISKAREYTKSMIYCREEFYKYRSYIPRSTNTDMWAQWKLFIGRRALGAYKLARETLQSLKKAGKRYRNYKSPENSRAVKNIYLVFAVMYIYTEDLTRLSSAIPVKVPKKYINLKRIKKKSQKANSKAKKIVDRTK